MWKNANAEVVRRYQEAAQNAENRCAAQIHDGPLLPDGDAPDDATPFGIGDESCRIREFLLGPLNLGNEIYRRRDAWRAPTGHSVKEPAEAFDCDEPPSPWRSNP